MPAANTFSQRSQNGPFDDDASESWSMPMLHLGQTQINISYSVFVAMAVIAALAAIATPREGNGDIPWVMLIGVSFWGFGWLVQIVSALSIFAWMRCQCSGLTIGLWGVEGTRRAWTASQCVAMVSATLFPVLLLGVSLLVVDYTLGQTSQHLLWIDGFLASWRTPSLGLSSADSLIQAGAWLCFLQVVCQTLPFPTTLGRMGLIATVSMAARESDPRIQTRQARLAIRIFALAMVVTALTLLVLDEHRWRIQWPMFLVLGLVMWLTSQLRDVSEQISSFHELSDEQILQWLDSEERDAESEVVGRGRVGRVGLISKIARVTRTWNQRRKARRAMEREHAEADDAIRLDEVLDRLHTHGHDSLSDKDRALLMRVSRNLQRQRSESMVEVHDV